MPRYDSFDLDIQNVKINDGDFMEPNGTAYSCEGFGGRPGCYTVRSCGASLEICPDIRNEDV